MLSAVPEAKEAVDSEGAAPHKRGKTRAQFGDLTISSDFDSGTQNKIVDSGRYGGHGV